MSKFRLPGHSFLKIKGFKSTSKEDGRAASSAFQMKSPFRKEEKKSTLDASDWTDIKKAKDLKKKGWSASVSPDKDGIKFNLKKTW